MRKERVSISREVTMLLDDLNHPLRAEIEQLRLTILNTVNGLTENVKWNGPNYCYKNEDRITMRVHPPKQIQLIFHRGAKKRTQPKNKIISDKSGFLIWKENDCAVVSFKTMADIENCKLELEVIVRGWIKATT